MEDSGFRYLLTVWERGGTLIFQEYLKDAPLCWNNCGKYLLYMIDSGYVKILNCEDGSKSQNNNDTSSSS